MGHRITRRALIAATAGVLTFSVAVTAEMPRQYQPLPQSEFRTYLPDVVVAASPSAAPSVAEVAVAPAETRSAQQLPRPRPRIEARSTPRPRTTSGHSLLGKASWYCRRGVSICHHSYPDRAGLDLYAAACGKLRRAMGKWRGRTVTVAGHGRSVQVKLIDWCGSTDKTIDLYYDAMHALGGSGVLRVKVSW